MMAFSTYPSEEQKTSHNNKQFPYMKYKNVNKESISEEYLWYLNTQLSLKFSQLSAYCFQRRIMQT